MSDAASGRWEHFAATIRSRHMVRSYTSEPVADELIDDLLDLSRRAPSAGNTQAVEFLALGAAGVDAYWDTTLADRRASFRWQGLLDAPVLVLPYVRPSAYLERYGEQDKAQTGLGGDEGAWTVPYWWVDGGAAVQNLLLGAHAVGLGACFFGQFDHEAAVRRAFGVPDEWRALGTVALGHPDGDDPPGRSAARPRPALRDVVHRGRWSL